MRNSPRRPSSLGLASLLRSKILICVLTVAATSSAAVAADAARGAKLAKQWCASCHIVSSDQARGADFAPPFASIAKRPGFTADRIAQFLMRSHPRMPDVHLTRDEARDLGAYIASLAQ